jgi:hypothetical protein
MMYSMVVNWVGYITTVNGLLPMSLKHTYQAWLLQRDVRKLGSSTKRTCLVKDTYAMQSSIFKLILPAWVIMLVLLFLYDVGVPMELITATAMAFGWILGRVVKI